MGYLAVWKVLEEILAEFRKKRITVPNEIMKDLRSAKTFIRILKPSCHDAETLQKVERCLGSVEFFLITEGEKILGEGQANQWLKRINEARKKPDEEVEEVRFVPRVPRDEKWIRVVPSDKLPLQRLETLATRAGLSYDSGRAGSFLVHGRDSQVKDFIKKMTTECHLKAKK